MSGLFQAPKRRASDEEEAKEKKKTDKKERRRRRRIRSKFDLNPTKPKVTKILRKRVRAYANVGDEII